MFTKIGKYTQNPPEQGFLLASDNILTATQSSEVRWRLLPDGDEGPGAPPGFSKATTVAEEWHVLPLHKTPGFAAVYRTNVGLLGTAWTSEATAKGGWSTGIAQFAWGFASNSSSTNMRNPRGPITLRQFGDVILMLWYNNGAKSFGDTSGASVGNGKSQRNPYWLSSAQETQSGQ